MRRLYVAGNWKMNLTRATATKLAGAFARACPQPDPQVQVGVFPPFPYLTSVVEAVAGSGVEVGAQNAYSQGPGAFTGETSAEMIRDVGGTSVILGHSERRHILHETDAVINAKVQYCLSRGLKVILCVGELLAEREAGQTHAVLQGQMGAGLGHIPAEAMANIVLAYEPVWAIGTGVTASPEQAEEAHLFLRKWVAEHYNPQIAADLRILYGGSVNRAKVEALLGKPNVDGGLVGGASLIEADFCGIIEIARRVASTK